MSVFTCVRVCVYRITDRGSVCNGPRGTPARAKKARVERNGRKQEKAAAAEEREVEGEENSSSLSGLDACRCGKALLLANGPCC